MAKTLIVLLGPTGVGKTELSLRIAQRFKAEIISSDSRQLYKEMLIGTAAPTPAQLNRVKHHFVGELALTDYYSAAQFENDVIHFLEDYYQEHDIALMTGGSMMYIDAVCKGIDDLPTIDETLRKEIIRLYETEGLEPIKKQLRELDPVYYNQVDLMNPKRVIHALEICLMTGKPYSSLRTNTKKKRPFNIIKIGLTRDREELYERINMRVDEMMKDGLLREAEKLYPFKGYNSLNTVGYKELFSYIEGELRLEEAIEKIKRNTRVYSRKQMTWFKRDPEIVWFHPEDEIEIEEFIDRNL
ncbi:tRNA (adenosine(37)-N6)-dimethylallyltransferase MiaA [Parabacteroides sp. FAFU027]|uniref:tRNA (adenosine(37)-N6)-dimethylallyltransferase MiaA n=1 Tax=Parabacteroides sp. FAFU027 TaxID=2922715 RepID=UPI001FAFE556|nr:tRNA (adenosine(37)-N6)-dimethylallyltransferase MiaA [Parabacteroides sp. FAFU027]